VNSRSADNPIQNENDLLWLVYQAESSKGLITAYPKITYIPKGDRISPDIDLLTIYRSGEKTVLTGFETKVVNRRRNILGPFYAAFGQALCYFQFGVDQTYVIMGCYGLDEEKRADIETKIQRVWQFLSTHSLLPRYVGFKLFIEGKNWPEYSAEPEASFTPRPDSEADFKRDCLIRGKFVWGERWLRDRGALPPK
jgi:hypothetical protein